MAISIDISRSTADIQDQQHLLLLMLMLRTSHSYLKVSLGSVDFDAVIVVITFAALAAYTIVWPMLFEKTLRLERLVAAVAMPVAPMTVSLWRTSTLLTS